METFDNTRPVVAAMAVGIARATLEELRKILTDAGVEISYDKPSHAQSAAAAEFLRMEADWEASYQLTLRAAWQADNKIPNSKEASMAKAKAGRVGSDITLKAVELAGTIRLFRGNPAGEVGTRLEDHGHLRGHPADPAAGGRPPPAGPVVVRTQVAVTASCSRR